MKRSSKLNEGRVYNVRLGMGERTKGVYLGTNRKGYGEVFIVLVGGREISPRKYSFREYLLKGKNLDILSPLGPKFSSGPMIIDEETKGLIQKCGIK